MAQRMRSCLRLNFRLTLANTEIAECKHGCRLSDLSSDEEEDYFNSAAEVKLKGIVWNALNQDYLEKQALKAAAEAKRQVIVGSHNSTCKSLGESGPLRRQA